MSIPATDAGSAGHPGTPARSTVQVSVIPGDGIGPELVESALAVMTEASARDGVELVLREEPAGAAVYAETGDALLPGALDRLRAADGVLKGPVGLPEVRKPDGTEGGLLGGLLRIGLDTFANVRPIRLLPGVRTVMRSEPGSIDYVIVRENTEGLYLSRGAGVRNHHAASDQMLITRAGTERVVRFAFEQARQRRGAPRDGVRRVTCVDKSNVLRSFALFRDVFDEVAARYPDIEADHLYADAAAHALVVEPERFDVLVMENFLGDILSDLGAGTVGGLGMCPSGNIGAEAAYFEPIHGSAPMIAGKNLANPVSQILSGALLLRHCGQEATAARIEAAVESAFATGRVSILPSGGPEGGTESVTQAVIGALG
ncbi:isocitrate/isopropylmalate dehydrogenase family protein [Cryobacterium tepidiphilum]|uniref:Isocitrate/isopropylmalate dehydrogenase family protein n=1 Tax=Cryobacterium tepidiphilum TaxID=2486026 RepID=A0A3M8L301_9MICO|nr:isocitrate/isopropylmalate family dehydrogenase [Cryobacterium tepidiphilum]RNE59279.1 isocitrate/isopropylmalate dehydrogenase family protein [Cryobacterium tepidiphilum]